MKKVWIDAGHGGKDPGAVANGLKEKDIVLSVALEIKKRLETNYDGVQVLLSRSTDVFLELAERTSLANKAGADILVSIHCNAGGGSGGFETFRYTKASAASAALQNVLHTEIIDTLNKDASVCELEEAGLGPHFAAHDHALFYNNASGVPFTTAYIAAKGDPLADLYEDIAAEEKARATYQWLIDMTDDVDLQDSLKFLREREIIHAIRFKEAVQIIIDDRNQKRVF